MLGPESVSKPCSRCGQDIEVEQQFCQYCGQQFAVRRLGYCATCHQRVVVDSGAACPTCGNDVVDVVVESEPLEAPATTTETASVPVAQPSTDLADRPARRGLLIVAAISLLACGLMIAASFMPWLGSAAEGGGTFSGWDLYELQRDAGNSALDSLAIPGFFTDAEGVTWLYFTGLATFLGGLCLAGLTIVSHTWAAWVRRRKLQPRDQPLSVRLGLVLLLLVGIVAVMPAWFNAVSFFAAGEASGASLEYGLILLWAATLVGLGSMIGPTFSSNRSTRPVLHALIGTVVMGVALLIPALIAINFGF